MADGEQLVQEPRTPARSWVGWAASAWAALFAARGVYWGLGGTLGLGTLSPGLQQAAVDGDVGVTVALWVATASLVAVSIVAGLVALPPGRRPVRLRPTAALRWLSWIEVAAGGVLLAQGLSYASLPARAEWTTTVAWYALLWGPWFLIGGTLLLAAGALALRDARALASP